jgi:membrane protease subunit (stomatin/prohibitin family)
MRLKTQTVVLIALVALFAFFLGRGTDTPAAGKQAGVVNQQQNQDQTRTSLQQEAQQQAQLAEQAQADPSVSGSGGESSEGGAENEDCEAPGAEPGEVEDQDEPGDVDKLCPERP